MTAKITRGNCHIKQIRIIVIVIKVEAIGRTIVAKSLCEERIAKGASRKHP